MSHDSKIVRATLAAQNRFFRVAERDYGLSLKAISLDTGIKYDTLRSWTGGVTMPLYAINEFADAGYPDALLSILTAPGSRDVVTPANPGDLHRLAVEASGFTADYTAARAEHSPGGANIVPLERQRLERRARAVVVAAGAA